MAAGGAAGAACSAACVGRGPPPACQSAWAGRLDSAQLLDTVGWLLVEHVVHEPIYRQPPAWQGLARFRGFALLAETVRGC